MEPVVFDVECYRNFFLVLFKRLSDGQQIRFQISPNRKLNKALLTQTLESNLLIGFNSTEYDLPMIQLALTGRTTEELKEASDLVIKHNLKPRDFARQYGLSRPKWNHVDLLPVAPLKASLKTYGGRLHCRKLQDLPINPDKEITAEEAALLAEYCGNDLENTEILYRELEAQIALREGLSKEYRQDLRSRSDAQVAEAVISAEVEKINRAKPARPQGLEGRSYKYKVPDYISYRSPQLKAMLEVVREADFTVGDSGSIILPPALGQIELRLWGAKYRMGIGGLHSSETRVCHVANVDTLLIDRDVASYYPRIILNQGLYPQHLGPAFLEVYQSLVDRRLTAKRAGDKGTAESLKIAINGIFGKLGNKWSVVYAPDLLIQVTLTGQLSLLMLIDMIEGARIPVISANTDGVLIKCHAGLHDHLTEIIGRWEKATAFETEETRYSAVYSKDVNNYIAIKTDGKVKGKGLYSVPWGGLTEGPPVFKLQKNPSTTIVVEAVIKLLRDGIPLEQTIKGCRDITKFVSVRSVTGGALVGGNYLGKSVRWYYALGSHDILNYQNATKKGTHNKVPKTEGSKPLMELPEEFPSDVNYKWYIAEAESVLNSIGYAQGTLFAAA